MCPLTPPPSSRPQLGPGDQRRARSLRAPRQAAGPPPTPSPRERRRRGSARQVRARHRAGCAHAPSPRGCPHAAPGVRPGPRGGCPIGPSDIGSLTPPHDSLATESRQPPEFLSPSPPPQNEIQGRAASGLRTRIALSGRLAGRKGRAAFPGQPFLLPSCPQPLPRPLPCWYERFRLATASLPGCGACPVRGPSRPGFPRDANPLLRVFAAARRAGREGGVRGGFFPGPSGTRARLRT